MANICDVSLIARGFKTKEEIDRFAKILDQENRDNELWMPYFDVYSEIDYDSNTITAEGWCKWSADRILDEYILEVKDDNPNITSLEELSVIFGVDIEILATECGCNVGEHFLIEDGEVSFAEYFDYAEYEAFDSYEEFVEENGDVIDRETWASCDEDWISVGEPETPFGILQGREYDRLAE